jgi:hypothetical protein
MAHAQNRCRVAVAPNPYSRRTQGVAPPRVVPTQHLRIEHVVAPVIAPMAERSPDDALASQVPSWRVLEARRARARRTERRLPVVAITIGLHRAHVGSAAG